MQVIIAGLPTSADHVEVFSKAQANDRICSKLIEFCRSGWPPRNQLDRALKDYWRFRGNMTLSNTLLLFQVHIVIPSSMRQETLAKIHHGHQGIQRCKLCVASSVWWPGVSSAIEQFVQSCPTCQRLTPSHREPSLITPLLSYPWERITADLFKLKGSTYLLVTDYYSKFVEVQRLTATTTLSPLLDILKLFLLDLGSLPGWSLIMDHNSTHKK